MKTPTELRREICYFAGQLVRTTDRATIKKLHAAIRSRERELDAALVRAGGEKVAR